MVKRWLDDIGYRTIRGYKMPKSRIYEILRNPFYYGDFRFGKQIYKGNHDPLISKSLFDKAQTQLYSVPKQWSKHSFPFKKLCICGKCGGNITAELRYRKIKGNNVNTHIYYHCNHY